MLDKNNYWDLLLKSFDEFEDRLEANLEDEYLDKFFDHYDVLIKKFEPENWQWQELKIRFEKINEKLAKAKSNLDKERLEHGKNQINFGKYLKNLELNKK
jgi:hypothetical protein